MLATDVTVSDSLRDHVADTSADKLATCRDSSDGDKTCLQKWGLADTTRHWHFQLRLWVLHYSKMRLLDNQYVMTQHTFKLKYCWLHPTFSHIDMMQRSHKLGSVECIHMTIGLAASIIHHNCNVSDHILNGLKWHSFCGIWKFHMDDQSLTGFVKWRMMKLIWWVWRWRP